MHLEPDARRAFLAAACGTDADLLREVQTLLDAAPAADELLENLAHRAGALFSTADGAADDGAAAGIGGMMPARDGRQFGPYRLVRRIGEGGMGVVFLAVRTDKAFEKEVAIKLLPLAHDTAGMRRRFAEEQRILARLEHPGIARLLDAGVAGDGTPYVVMEYVDGESIDKYCEARELDLDARLGLFLQVCEAVDWAHRAFVVHRDIKPGNVLVTPQGDAKLLDFGIAKVLVGAGDQDRTSLTQLAGRPVTLSYASPEQIRGDAITTATDVYSLGVLLYRLLTGRPPFDLSGQTHAGAETVICHEMPVAPSAVRLDSSDAATLRLQRRLKGDLDSIILTALEKEPGRRYPAVPALVQDIRNYLEQRPVHARPASYGYRLQKLVRRRPQVVALVAVITLAAVTYLGIVTRHNSRLASEQQRTQTEAVKAERVSEFLMGLFTANNPDMNEGRVPTALDLLESGTRTASALDDEPAVKAQMLDLMGQMYMTLGRFAEAEPLFQDALDIRRNVSEPSAADLAGVLDRLGDLLQRTGRHEEAQVMLLESIEKARLAGDTPTEANAHNDLGLSYYEKAQYTESETAHREALALRTALFGTSHERTAASQQNLALTLSAQGRTAEAEALYLEALATNREVLGPDHSAVALTLVTLSRLYSERGDFDRARPMLEEALNLNVRRFGPVHPRVALSSNDLGAMLARAGAYAEAEVYFRDALEIRTAALGAQHPHVAISLNNLSFVMLRQDRLDEAAALRAEALAIARGSLGDRHDNTAIFALNYGEVLELLGRHAEAERLYREALATLDDILPAGHVLIANPLVALGRLLLESGRAVDAEPHLAAALELRSADGDGASIAEAESLLGAALTMQQPTAHADTMLLRGYQQLQRLLGDDAPRTRAARARLVRFRPHLGT